MEKLRVRLTAVRMGILALVVANLAALSANQQTVIETADEALRMVGYRELPELADYTAFNLIGHAFNVELPDGEVYGMTAAHVCNVPRWNLEVLVVLENRDLCVLDQPLQGVEPFKTIVEPEERMTANVLIHMWPPEPLVYRGEMDMKVKKGLTLSIGAMAVTLPHQWTASVAATFGFSGSAVFTDDRELIGVVSAGVFPFGRGMAVKTFVEPIAPALDELMEAIDKARDEQRWKALEAELQGDKEAKKNLEGVNREI